MGVTYSTYLEHHRVDPVLVRLGLDGLSPRDSWSVRQSTDELSLKLVIVPDEELLASKRIEAQGTKALSGGAVHAAGPAIEGKDRQKWGKWYSGRDVLVLASLAAKND